MSRSLAVEPPAGGRGATTAVRRDPGLPSLSLRIGRDAPAREEEESDQGDHRELDAVRSAPRLLVQRSSLVEVAGAAFGVTGGLARDDRSGGLLVDDETQSLTAGQMKKTPFLAELRRVACEASDRELRKIGRTAEGCPYIDQILARYATRPAGALERAIRRYAPEARSATGAMEYLGPVATRLGQGVATWTTTGRMPDNVPGDLEGGGVTGLMGPGRALFKGTDGGAGRGGVDAAALAARLGPGRPLDGSARTRMEAALGHPFGDVRIHADERAAELSRELEARAFTLGSHVAFGSGELRPGEPAGDVLLAHELAHVVQQRGAPWTAEASIGSANDTLERDADDAAAGAVASLHGPRKGRRGSLRRGGLRLQRCGRSGASDRELQAYLLVLDAGAIEAGPDSHRRAREIATRWARGGSPFVLTATRKRMLLLELTNGSVSDEDRDAVLEILERSYNFELSVMFTGSMREDLAHAFSASYRRNWLADFFQRRFTPAQAPVHPDLESPFPATAPTPRGHPVPLGEELPPAEEETPMEGGNQRWNVPCLLGILCEQDRSVIDSLHDNMVVQSATRIVADEWTFTGGAWHETHRDNILGINRREEHLVVIRTDRTCAQAATTLFHEVHHEGQSPAVPWETREIEAYTVTAEWNIRRGIPGSFITTDPATQARIPDAPAIAEHVRGYPGMATPGERVIGKEPDGRTRVRRHDGTEFVRAPIEGDRFKVRTRPEGAHTIDREQWRCP